MRVIGIDPGVARTGVAVVERVGSRPRAVYIGVLRTPPGAPLPERLAHLRTLLAALVAEHRPSAVAIERFFFNAHVRAAMAVGQASGVALSVAGAASLPVADYTPAEVKQAVVGVGNAGKAQVQTMVTAILRLPAPPRPADAADACALALCHLSRSRLQAAVDARAVAR